MAYAALVSLSQTLLQEVTYGDQNQIKSLHEKLCFLQAFLEEYASNRLDPLEGRIREAVYRAEDIIEIHILNMVSKQRRMQDHEKRCNQDLQRRFYLNLQRVIKEINSIVEEAKERKRSCKVEDLTPGRSSGAGSSRRSPILSSDSMVGFNEELLNLKARLCREPDELRIISIVGMGGIGKTTLAKTTFDDSLVEYHFDVRAWITISQEYCMRDILLGLLASISAMTEDLSKKRDEILAEHVYKSLKGRRYLVIMDDMWSTKAWDEIRRVLPNDNNGSRSIITTRLYEVAIYADSSSPPQHLQLLNKDQSWTLLQQKVFAQDCCPPELEKVGKMIVERCRGLPLGIVLVAGLLSKIVRNVNNWERFAVNVSSTLATDDEHLLKILSLSYNNLPHHLRACFLYMGGFPEDHEIPISKLTKLWTAEGFLKLNRSKNVEEVAREFIFDLVKRNLILITKRSSNGRFRFCRIHDLLRDFCIRKAEEESFLHVSRSGSTTQQGIESKRRLCSFIRRCLPSNPSGSLLRSILFFNKSNFTCILLSFRLLRVFDGTNVCLDLLNPAATQLIHLRYLAFSYACVHLRIPGSISRLRNLQTLIIQPQYGYFRPLIARGRDEIHLPSEIWKMPNLRHLILHNYCFLPVHFGKGGDGNTHVLKNLQTLSRVVNFSFAREIIEMIPNLKKLGVVYYNEQLIDRSRYYLYNLRYLHQLESLNLYCALSSISEHSLRSHFAQNFALPRRLKKLTLTGCNLSWQNLSIVGQLPYLGVLKLRHKSVAGEQWKSVEGEFLQLKFLLMERLDIKYWRADYTHFPSLEHLIIRDCRKLEEIPSEIGDIPTLRSIEVAAGSQSARDSANRIQEEQESYENDSLRVHVHNLLPRSWF